MQRAWAVLHCHLWPVRLYRVFLHYLINGEIFKKMLLNTKCVFWFSLQLLSETFLILRRTERDMIKNLNWSSCKVPDILSDFNENWIFLTDLRKIFKCQISWKIRPMGAELFHADGRTDMTKLFASLRKNLGKIKKSYLFVQLRDVSKGLVITKREVQNY